jgi:hypothetical protein
MSVVEAETEAEDRRFQIFRHKDAPFLQMDEITGVTETTAEGMRKVREAGGNDEGQEVRVLFEIPGFSLTYAWFKSGYPLPRHSHKMDCAYYIVGGSLQLGPDVLGKGVGFFVPGGAPYTYIVGPEGVEVLEFRNDACHDINIMAGAAAFWAKAAQNVPAARERWATEKRPSPTAEERAKADA